MTNNFDTIIEIYNQTMGKIYKAMNDYLENIFNSPSTINRIMKYYVVGFPADPSVHERYIMFGGTIIRIYEMTFPEIECGIDGIKIKKATDP